MKKILTIYIVLVTLFLLSLPASAQEYNITTDSIDKLDIKSEIANIQKNSDDSFTIDYKYTVKNNSDKLIYQIIATSNLDQSFGDLDYEILELKSSELKVDYNFNGKTNLGLTEATNQLESGASGEIKLKVKLYPKKNKGPFENFVEVYGSYDGPNSSINNDGNNSGENDNSNQTQYPTPDPKPPVVEGDLTPREIKFTLVDAENDVDLFPLTEGMVIKLSSLPTDRLNVRAGISPATVGSIVFDLNGKQKYHVENNPLYAIGGNEGNDYRYWLFKVGKQNLTASVNTMKNGNGETISSKTINFTILGEQPKDPVVETTPPTGDGSIENPTGSGDPTSETPSENSNNNDNGNSGETTNIENTSDSDSTSFSLSFDENGEVLAEITNKIEKVDTEDSKVLGEATLVNTGINLSDTVFLGVLIIILVVELNFFEMEDRVFNNIYHYAGYFGNREINKFKLFGSASGLKKWLSKKDDKLTAHNKNKRKFHTRL